jgi:lipoprotein-releasing system permease protein
MSRLPFELLLALRYLRPKRTFVSIITLISIMGVMLGVAVLIIVISVMSGFDSQLREKVLGFNAHLKVYQLDTRTDKQQLMTNCVPILRAVTGNPNVRSAAPFAMGQVMIETEPEAGVEGFFAAPYLRGVDPRSDASVGTLSSNMIEGNFDLSGHSILLGTDLAGSIDVHVGDRVAVYSPRDVKEMKESLQHPGNTNQEASLPADYTVQGIFDAGYYEYNQSVAIASLDNFQDLYNLGDDVDGLMVMLKDPYQADTVKAQLEEKLGDGYRVVTWKEESSLMLAVLVEKNMMLYILFFIVIVAAFGITCTLITFVVLKTREIGVLKALGATSRQIMWIFLSQSMVVSVLGVLTGTAAGMLALAYRNEFLHVMRQLTGLELFPASIYGFSELPALIVPRDICVICGGSFLICMAAAAFPAWNASRLRPVEALRHD